MENTLTEDFRQYRYTDFDEHMYESSKYFKNGWGISIIVFYTDVIDERNGTIYHKKGDVSIRLLENLPLDPWEIKDEFESKLSDYDLINEAIEMVKKAAPHPDRAGDISEIIYRKTIAFAKEIKDSPSYGKMNIVQDAQKDILNLKKKFDDLREYLDPMFKHSVYSENDEESFILPDIDSILQNAKEPFYI